MAKVYKVYVSSTIADLRRERRAVFEWLRGARHQAVDSYLPDSETVRDSCLEDVDSCDVYVVIVGHRYGFVPEDDNPEGLSITQLEFRRAGKSGKPRVALLRASIPDIELSDLGDPKRLALVQAFRDEVAGQVRPALFRDESGLIGGLSNGVQAALAKLAERGKRGGPPPAGTRAAPVVRLAPRPPLLAGREELLASLEARLGGGPGVRAVVLSGLGGAGKTSVAVEYAHRHLDQAAVAWQFAAEDAAVLTAGFTDLAARLGGVSGEDPVAAVHSALAAHRGGWVLVFDNAPDRASVAGLVPPSGAGQVLITTRNAHWPLSQLVEVPVLDTAVAARFLMDRTGDADARAAAGVAEAVGGLPLALEQAAAYIQATGDTLGGYLALFRRRRDMLAHGEPTGHPDTVATTWTLAFKQVEASAPQAVGLLRLLAFCAPEAVPLGLLLQPRPGLAEQLPDAVAGVLGPLLADELAARDAVAALRRYSLVRPAGDGAVSVHRLVQAVTTDQMPAELSDAWRRAAAALIEAALPGDPRQPGTWPVFAALLPHAQAALPADSDGMAILASYLGYSGGFLAAREFCRALLEERTRGLGPEHENTLLARGHLAWWMGEAGDAAGARDEYAALVPAYERVLGPENRDTLIARSSLARWTAEMGDAAGARDQLAALVPIMERVLGPEARQSLVARLNLASWTGEARDAAAARDQLAALVPIMERVLGPEHPDTLVARVNLARWTGEVGDAAGARDEYAAMVPVYERVLGPEHPDTLLARVNLAYWTGEAGDAAGARDQLAAMVPVYEPVLGPEHPATLLARAFLAYWTGEAGDAAGARDQYAALLPIRERVLGPEHPNTLNTRANLAHWTKQAAGEEDA